MSKILITEDDESLGRNLLSALKKAGYECSLANSVSTALEILKANTFDIILLDVGLPDGTGFDILEYLQKNKMTSTPVLFLSAMNTAEYRLKGFELGAIDYIPKPFHLKELLLRIDKNLPKEVKLEQVIVNGITINLNSFSITYPNGHTEYPATRDFKVLKHLISSAPKVVSRKELVSAVIDSNSDFTPRTIDNSVVRLRQLLQTAEIECIRAVRGLGYQWVGTQD
jgi:DNA-binding response OmpR family regulator